MTLVSYGQFLCKKRHAIDLMRTSRNSPWVVVSFGGKLITFRAQYGVSRGYYGKSKNLDNHVENVCNLTQNMKKDF